MKWVLRGLGLLVAVGVYGGDKPVVATGIEPIGYLVKRIAGDAVKVEVMVPANASPHSYEPKPRQMVALAAASCYFEVGVPFETVWVPRFVETTKSLRVVRLQDSVVRMKLAAHDHHDHDHDHGHDHGHQAHDEDMPDPHVWLSPSNCLQMGRQILAELSERWPESALTFEANWRRLAEELVALDTRLLRRFRSIKGATFLVYHPSWGYFARDYGLRQVAVEKGGREPKPAELKALIDQARREKVKAILVQPQFDRRSAAAVAKAVHAEVLVADPLATDLLANLRNVADNVEKALGDSHAGHRH